MCTYPPRAIAHIQQQAIENSLKISPSEFAHLEKTIAEHANTIQIFRKILKNQDEALVLLNQRLIKAEGKIESLLDMITTLHSAIPEKPEVTK